jgi:hypothetical protein
MKRIIVSLAEVKRRIQKSGFQIIVQDRLRDNHGTQIITNHGHVVKVYDTGTVLIQGKHQEQMRIILTRNNV